METILQVRNLSKNYGTLRALENINLDVKPGRIVGLIGPNGAGKTTFLKAITGQIAFEGDVSVLGFSPVTHRENVMEKTGIIHDIPVLPPWMLVKEVLNFLSKAHPAFNIEIAKKYLEKTDVKLNQKIKNLSKGMKTQLHLATVLVTDTSFLVLDEPTHGLDILFRKQFYNSILEDYFESEKSIIISTHQIEEVEHILTDVIFIKHGKILLNSTMENLKDTFIHIMVGPNDRDTVLKYKTMGEMKILGRYLFLVQLEKASQKDELEKLGEVNTPSVADVFVALMDGQYSGSYGGAS